LWTPVGLLFIKEIAEENEVVKGMIIKVHLFNILNTIASRENIVANNKTNH
jgi:hypothetical protein